MLKKMDLKLKNEHQDFIKNFEYNLSSDSKFITKIRNNFVQHTLYEVIRLKELNRNYASLK